MASLSLCRCGTQRERKTSGPTSSFPGRQYFVCPDCNSFEWADKAVHLAAAAGPTCACGKATVQRSVKKDGPNKGRTFWGCATWPGGCGHFEFQETSTPPRAATAATTSSSSSVPVRPPLPGYCQNLTDWRQTETLQMMMACDPALLGHGRDVRQPGEYDKLEVVGAWHITNQSRKQTYAQALRRVGATPVPPEQLAQLPTEYAQAVSRLGGDPLDSRSGEAFLLHGTEPQHLHSILFEGLDPTIAANGLFGRGTYFAESAGKIDQYATVDHKFQSDGPLAELHEKLYGIATKHPGRVRYALVCRVALGQPAVTKDGQTRLEDGAALFSDGEARAALAPLAGGVPPQSLRAETGERIQRFREYVVSSPDQILVEYLVAYQRKRTLCVTAACPQRSGQWSMAKTVAANATSATGPKATQETAAISSSSRSARAAARRACVRLSRGVTTTPAATPRARGATGLVAGPMASRRARHRRAASARTAIGTEDTEDTEDTVPGDRPLSHRLGGA